MRFKLRNAFKQFTDQPLKTAETLCGIAQIFSTLESLDPKERTAGGINDWSHLRSTIASRSQIDDFLAKPALVNAALLGRLTASLALVFASKPRARQLSATYIALSHAVLGKQTINGGDGADQMASIVRASSAIGRTDKGKNQDLAVTFIAAQLMLSYFVSGITKIFGAEWRNGTALERVMRTHTYGDRKFYKLLRQHPGIGELITRFTVAIEIAFPILAINKKTRPIALAVMGGFHLANVKLMGLGRFMLSFMATYPCLLKAFEENDVE